MLLKFFSSILGFAFLAFTTCMTTMPLISIAMDSGFNCIHADEKSENDTPKQNKICELHEHTDVSIQSNSGLIKKLSFIQNAIAQTSPFILATITLIDTAHYKQMYPDKLVQKSLYLSFRDSVMLRV